MVLRDSIEKLLVASASSCISPAKASELNLRNLSRGERTEFDAILWLQMRGDRVVLRRFETPFAEIDILAMKPNGRLLVCEVKSSFWPDDRALGLGFRQRARLSRAAFWIATETGRDVEISLLGPAESSSSTQRGQFLEVPIF